MDIEAAAKQITGPCACHGSYTYREMDEPDWRFHKFHADFVDALRKAQDEAYERAAKECDDIFMQMSYAQCNEAAENIRSLKSGVK